jgi:hypothetical protein
MHPDLGDVHGEGPDWADCVEKLGASPESVDLAERLPAKDSIQKLCLARSDFDERCSGFWSTILRARIFSTQSAETTFEPSRSWCERAILPR